MRKINMEKMEEILKGKWTYRSLRNDPDVSADFGQLGFGRGIIDFQVDGHQIFDSVLDMGAGLRMNLIGEIKSDADGPVLFVKWRGEGVPGSRTEGWIYDYYGNLAFEWENSIDQATVLVGSVIRTVEHDGAPAGYVGTFYMVKQ
jgi:hypothetical protein